MMHGDAYFCHLREASRHTRGQRCPARRFMESTCSQNGEIRQLRERCAALERELDLFRHSQKTRLDVTSQVHRSLLPKPIRHDRIWIDVRYVPVEEIGGDYCQVRFPDSVTCYITICDVMGHGTASALLATRISSEVRYGILYRMEPADLVQSLQRFMIEHFQGAELFLTFFAARIDFDRREIAWSGAGHPGPLLLSPAADPQSLPSQNMPLGLDLPDPSAVRQDRTPVQPGDRLFFFTDGLYEVIDARGRQLGLDGFGKLAQSTMGCDLFEVADRVFQEIQQYQYGPDADDQTLVVAEIR
ncbi:MAG: serine/threonine-protein phosphatase [Planctomycetaceae bacterium]|nr:MAG: serine/threonine-protein phosphatase [Planctomycetaceae bacterium]